MKKGYCNGSDMLLYIEDVAIGHCTSHKMTCSSETTDHAVKAPADDPITASLFKEKTVTGLSISISTDGLVFYGEKEAGYAKLLKAWKTGKPVTAKCMERETADNPYFKGSVIIDSLERTDDAGADSTYSASFSNNGAPEILDETALSEGEAPAT